MTWAPLAPTMIGDQRNVIVGFVGRSPRHGQVDDLREPTEICPALPLDDASERGHRNTRVSQTSMRKFSAENFSSFAAKQNATSSGCFPDA